MRRADIERRPGVRAVLPAALTSLVMLAGSGCYQGGDRSSEPEVDSSLAALMADGKLPAGMEGPAMRPDRPFRFCEDRPDVPDGGIEDDGGVSEMPPFPTAGRGGVGTAGRISLPTTPPVAVADAGTAGAGGAGGRP